jgi:putative inorganic carbon (hco3(-)) transporter
MDALSATSGRPRVRTAGKQEPRALRTGPVATCPTGFALFLVLTTVLFVRPTDIITGLEGLPIYEVMILACLAASLPAVLNRLRWQSLSRQPVDLLVTALLPAILLADLSHGDVWHAHHDGGEFLKVLIFYFLLVSLLDTRARMMLYLRTLFVLIFAIALLSVLAYRGIVEIKALNPIAQGMGFNDYGELLQVPRLLGPGIFHDPNDFSLILVTAMVIGIQLLAEPHQRWARVWRLPMIALIGYAFFLTRSRGGFLSLIGAGFALLMYRYGWRRALWISVALLPVLLLLFGGRQTNIDLENGDDTAQGRIHLWRDSLVLFHRSPLFGIGPGQLAEANGLVAHNSYVQAFGELGMVGGILFIGALYVPFSDLARLGGLIHKPIGLKRDAWTGCLLAILVGYVIGMYSLTRVYEVSTYAIIGLIVAFTGLLAAQNPDIALIRGRVLVRRVIGVSLLCLIWLEGFVRLLVT